MYNRYIPNGTAYTRVLEEDAPPLRRAAEGPRQQPPPAEGAPRRPAQQRPRAHQAERQAPPPPSPGPVPPPTDRAEPKPSMLSGLLKHFKLEDLDTGDILLLLILVFLVLDGDGDNLELIITLGLVVLFSLGDQRQEEPQDPG